MDKECKNTYSDTIFWGEKLLYLNESNYITNKDNKTILFYKVKRISDGLVGFVNSSYLIKDPLYIGVVSQDQVVVYNTPSMRSTEKNVLTPPTLCYVVEKKEPDWFKIEVFNPPINYALYTNYNKIFNQVWSQSNFVNINKSDVDIIISSLISLNNFRYAKALYDKDPNEKNLKNLEKVRTAEDQTIRNLINTSLSKETLSIVSKILDIITPPQQIPSENQEIPENYENEPKQEENE